MNKILLFCLLIISSITLNAQTIATWNGINGVTVSGAGSNGITAGNLSRGAGITQATGASFISRGFTSSSTTTNLASAIMDNDYLEFSITTPANSTTSATEIQLAQDRSPTGPSSCQCQSSLDGFTTVGINQSLAYAIPNAAQIVSITLSGFTVIPANSTITFRLYCWGASSGAGNSDIESGLLEDDIGLQILGSVILPIEIISFTATPQEKSTQLNWTTSSEINNDYMAIERSTDSKNFQEIGKIQGAGTTNERQEYSFIDEAPVGGNNYYRLRQVDYDGAFEYSDVVQVNFRTNDDQIAIYPNPTSDVLTVKFPTFWEGETTMSITNSLGQVIKVINNTDDAIMVQDLPNGFYLLTVENGNQTVTKPFQKQ